MASPSPDVLTPRATERRKEPPPTRSFVMMDVPPAVLDDHAGHSHAHTHDKAVPDIKISERIVNVNPAGLATAMRLNLLAGHTSGHSTCKDEDGLVSCTAMEDLEREFRVRREPNPDPAVQIANVVRHYLLKVYKDGLFRHARADVAPLSERLCRLCEVAADIFDAEPRLLPVDSPVYVLGDIHGNFEDLSFFLRQLSTFGEFEFAPHRVLFLGDYVDRGLWSVECIALLLAFKVLAPTKVFLLRGNHEFAEINGAVHSYGKASFLVQCQSLFGTELGTQVWTKFNMAFKYLPLAATVDERIFCVHGGIPRWSPAPTAEAARAAALAATPPADPRLAMLDRVDFPRFAYTACAKHDRSPERLLLTDLMWSDPVEQPGDAAGFAASDRGPTLSAFGDRAVDDFFSLNRFAMLIRAHEHKKVGLRVSNHRRIITVFSSSAYCGSDFGASILFVHDRTIRVVTKEVTRAAQIAYSHYEEDDDSDVASVGAQSHASVVTTPR